MRLGIKLLRSDSSLNSINQVNEYKIARGEDCIVLIQLVDQDQKDLRYIPANGATLSFEVPRSASVNAAPGGARVVSDYSIKRAAMAPFNDDRSIWQVILTGTDTSTLISTGIKITLTEDTSKKIASLGAAIKVIDNQNS